jgi:hypothetical protein
MRKFPRLSTTVRTALQPLLVLSFMTLPAAAQAQYCADAAWKSLGEAHGRSRLPEMIEDHWTRCQPLPSQRDRAIVALVYPSAGVAMPANPGDPMAGYEADLYLVDTAAGRVLDRQARQRPPQPDGSALTGVEIDTGTPALAPKVPSVALRLQHAGPSPERLDSRELLTLHAVQGDRLRPVLEDLASWTLRGAWDTRCAGEFTETRTVLKTGAGRTRGFVDLVAHTVQDRRTTRQQGDECVDRKAAPVSRRHTLRHDGQVYVAPTSR